MGKALRIFALAGLLWHPISGRAEGVEELPPPTQNRADAANAVPDDMRPTEAWGLVGARGRHYFAGTSGLFDYVQNGQRHVVVVEAEDPSHHKVTDDDFLYYREPVAGHRWAVARQASDDRRYRIYFQDASRPSGWQLWHRTAPTWEHADPAFAPSWDYSLEASCDQMSSPILELSTP